MDATTDLFGRGGYALSKEIIQLDNDGFLCASIHNKCGNYRRRINRNILIGPHTGDKSGRDIDSSGDMIPIVFDIERENRTCSLCDNSCPTGKSYGIGERKIYASDQLIQS